MTLFLTSAFAEARSSTAFRVNPKRSACLRTLYPWIQRLRLCCGHLLKVSNGGRPPPPLLTFSFSSHCTCAVFTLNTRTCLMNRANLFFFRPIAGMFTIGSRRTSDLLTIAAAPVLYSRRIRAQIQRRVESAYPTGERAKPASASLRNATHQRNQRRREHQRKYQSQGKEEEKEGKNAEDVCFPPSKGHCPEHELLVCCWLRDGGQGSVNSGSSLSNVFCQISGSERKS